VFDKAGNIQQRDYWVQYAKNYWENFKHLAPKPKDQGAVKSFLNWLHKLKFTVAPLSRGQYAPTIGSKPIPVNSIKRFPSQGFSVKSVDPLLILQLHDWIVDYAVAKYATPEIQHEYYMQKEFSKQYWMNYYFNDGWKIRYPNNSDGYQRWKRDITA
jgi:hypothetical protein